MSQTDFVVDKDNLEVKITRTFNATPERLWQAYTNPAEIVQWWSDTTIDKHEFEVGGAWRFVSRGGGQEFGFRGVFKEIDKPKKIVRTFEFEPNAGHIMTESVTFEPLSDRQTKVVTTSKYASIEDLNGMVGQGMERGATAGLDRLAKLVEQSG
jgi:uncharacterized protein YndB with AHSA1/START domain